MMLGTTTLNIVILYRTVFSKMPLDAAALYMRTLIIMTNSVMTVSINIVSRMTSLRH